MVQRTPIILNSDKNLQTLSTNDSLENVVSTGITVKNSSVSYSNISTINFIGSKIEAKKHKTLDNTSIIELLVSGGSTIFNQINPFVISNSSNSSTKVDIKPHRVLLPDFTVQKISTTKTIDISVSGDIQSGQSRSANTWYYIYVTDDSGYSNNAFFSTTKPNYRGFHPTINAKFVCTLKTDASSNILPFFKQGNTVYYKDNYASWTGSVSTAGTYIYVSNAIPPITDSYYGFSYCNSSTYSGRVYEINYNNTNRNWLTDSSYLYAFGNGLIKTQNNRRIVVAGSGSTTITHYVSGYIIDVDSPMMNIT